MILFNCSPPRRTEIEDPASKLFSPSLFSGYDRAVPGVARYRVVGTDESGNFSLAIHDVQEGDDATYECQVGPAEFNMPIRARAKLNVSGESIRLKSLQQNNTSGR